MGTEASGRIESSLLLSHMYIPGTQTTGQWKPSSSQRCISLSLWGPDKDSKPFFGPVYSKSSSAWFLWYEFNTYSYGSNFQGRILSTLEMCIRLCFMGGDGQVVVFIYMLIKLQSCCLCLHSKWSQILCVALFYTIYCNFEQNIDWYQHQDPLEFCKW